MPLVVLNGDYGGFELSAEGEALYELYAEAIFTGSDRSDIHLVRVVQELGEAANGPRARLKLVMVPDDVEWTVEGYDGIEWVEEKHRRWG